MKQFVFILRNEKLLSYRRLAILIFLLHLLFFIFYLLKYGGNMTLLAGIAISGLAMVFLFTISGRHSKPTIITSITFFLLAAVWIMLANYWLAIVLAILAFFDLVSGRKLVVSFFADRIEYPSFPKKTIRWNELNNVILKDRILTIDFKNDRLLQSEIAEESLNVDEKLFNAYCREQMQDTRL